jgi:hypothetical protein
MPAGLITASRDSGLAELAALPATAIVMPVNVAPVDTDGSGRRPKVPSADRPGHGASARAGTVLVRHDAFDLDAFDLER